MLTPQEIITKYHMKPNTAEGGYFALTYLNETKIPFTPKGGPEEQRNLASAVYYLLGENGVSYLHKLDSDMLYHFYAGSPVDMLLLYPHGHDCPYEVIPFSNDLANNANPMQVIPAGTWVGGQSTGAWSFMGVTMAPGFKSEEIGKRAELLAAYPQPEIHNLIVALTPD